jgi:GT2 family glycosyltransferase
MPGDASRIERPCSTPEATASGGLPVEISVVIVNWNSKNYVRQCLASLFQHCAGIPLEVIVVDGASFDGCDDMLAREFPQVRYIQSRENVGFARANNLGACQARGRCLLFLNPDTELIENSLAVLIRCLESLPAAGAAGCKLLNADRSVQTSCVQPFPTVLNQVLDSEFLRSCFPTWRLWGMLPLHQSRSEPVEVEVISGACILVRRDLFEKVGGFTERYFMYGEDLDLCFKILRAGFRVYYVPETTIVHYGGGCTQKGTSNFSNVMMRESVYRFLHFNRGLLSAAAYRAAMSVSALIRVVLILPLMLLPGHRVVQHGSGSLHKWLSIFRWSLGLETWVRTHS